MATSKIESVDDSELVLPRIPPPLEENTKPIEQGRRPISQRLQLRNKDDSGLSCTRQVQTSPKQLLSQLDKQHIDAGEWGVCVLRVVEVRALGLDVVHKPEGVDPGHCEIQGEFKRKTPKQLSKLARMLTSDEIETGIIAEP